MDENTAFTRDLRKQAVGALSLLIVGITLVTLALASSSVAYGQDSDQFELNRLVGYSVGVAMSLDYDASSCGNDSSQPYTTTVDNAGKVCGKSVSWALAVIAQDFGTTPREFVKFQMDKAAEQQKNLGGCESELYRAFIELLKMDFDENLAEIVRRCR